MKKQIALLGGQLIPVYWGIKERNPDHIHLIHTEQLKDKTALLKRLFNSKEFTYHLVDPYDFKNITSTIESIIFENEKDTWELNLTGGTKMMTLAAHNVFKDWGYESFYLDQKNQFYFFTEKIFKPIQGDMKIDTFLMLSGHSNIRNKTLSSIDKVEFDIASKMLDLMNEKDIGLLFSKIASKVRDPNIKSYQFTLNNVGTVEWSNDILKISTSAIKEYLEHKNAFKICFTGLWWELIIAKTVRTWSQKKEMMLSLEMLANTVHNLPKNEIDIVLNTGKTMVFIECKSGNVKQEDVNKMRAVKRLYGGISTKSILVCHKLPRKDLLEKCSDLDIEVFALQKQTEKHRTNGFIPLSSITSLTTKLSNLVDRVEL